MRRRRCSVLIGILPFAEAPVLAADKLRVATRPARSSACCAVLHFTGRLRQVSVDLRQQKRAARFMAGEHTHARHEVHVGKPEGPRAACVLLLQAVGRLAQHDVLWVHVPALRCDCLLLPCNCCWTVSDAVSAWPPADVKAYACAAIVSPQRQGLAVACCTGRVTAPARLRPSALRWTEMADRCIASGAGALGAVHGAVATRRPAADLQVHRPCANAL